MVCPQFAERYIISVILYRTELTPPLPFPLLPSCGKKIAYSTLKTYASYGTVGVRARYCAKHRKENMVNLTVKQCEHEMCVAQPSFNYKGQRKARWEVDYNSLVMCRLRHCANMFFSPN